MQTIDLQIIDIPKTLKNSLSMKKICIFLFCLVFTIPAFAQRLPLSGIAKLKNSTSVSNSVPIVLNEDLSISELTSVDAFSVRLSYDSFGDRLLLLQNNGNVYEVNTETGSKSLRFTSSSHGLNEVFGMDTDSNGNVYLVGNNRQGDLNQGQIARGRRNNALNFTWEMVAETEPYPLSNTAFDHTFNGIAVSPDDQFLYVNSGSRTDHGEIQDAGGVFPGVRETPITSAILRIPADSTGLYLEDDSTFLADNGYLFADGVRNSFDLTFDGNGRLFGTENAGDRDDSEELNWLKEGHHYGFPWRMGSNDTPMQFPGYDPDNDLLVNKSSTAYQGGYFYDDPNYPAPPAGIDFTIPVINNGPDADLYRDPVTGNILDASDEGGDLKTFTSHRSPLGLVFDTEGVLGGNYNNDGFVLSWTGTESSLLSGMQDNGEDIMHLEFTIDAQSEFVETNVTRIASGFRNPIDAELIGNTLYVLEFVFGGQAGLWAIEFPLFTSNENEEVPSNFSLEQNYPNPFNPETNISFSIPASGKVTLEVWDIMGRKVKTLIDSNLTMGEHSINFNATNLSSGMYLYRLQYENQVSIRKMTVIK